MFVTGAGISLASGIPTFRGSDPDAVWATDVMEMGTHEFFLRHPDKSWAWYLSRFDKTREAEPNPAHVALAEIERVIPSTRVITQNVDGLHLKAGTKNLVEIHGSAHKVRCTNKNCGYGAPRGFLSWTGEGQGYLEEQFQVFREEPIRKNVPRCPVCRKYLRAHVLWFDEQYTGHEDYRLDDAYEWTEAGTVLIFVGTSNSVGITMMASMPFHDKGLPIFNMDPHATIPDTLQIKGRAEIILPRLAHQLHLATSDGGGL